MQQLLFRAARPEEAEQVAALINHAYRGDHSRLGWTTEAHLLDGLRTSSAEIAGLIASEQAMILLCLRSASMVGSVCLQHLGDHAHLGMFVVEPALQNAGIGRQLLAHAEEAARRQWAVSRLAMAVITQRHELIAYYERRGYRRTHVLREFPVNPALWQPKVAGLQLEILEKRL